MKLRKMINVLLIVLGLQTQVFAQSGTDSAYGSVAASVGVEMSLAGSILASYGVGASVFASATTASQLLGASVEAGANLVVASVETVGDIVTVTFEVSKDVAETVLGSVVDVVTISVDFTIEAFKEIGKGLAKVGEVLAEGVVVAVEAITYTAAAGVIVLGYSILLAGAATYTLGYALTEEGSLYLD